MRKKMKTKKRMKARAKVDSRVGPLELGFSFVPLLFAAWTAQSLFAAGMAGGMSFTEGRAPSSAQPFEAAALLVGETSVGFDAP